MELITNMLNNGCCFGAKRTIYSSALSSETFSVSDFLLIQKDKFCLSKFVNGLMTFCF